MTLDQFIWTEEKALAVHAVPDHHYTTKVKYTVTNFDGESRPLKGWAWDDDDIEGYGGTLAGAFDNFYKELQKARREATKG